MDRRSIDRGSRMHTAEVLRWLEETGDESVREGMMRYGIPNDRAFGISIGELKRFSRSLGRNQALALELWKTSWYEARTLAAFVGVTEEFSGGQMDAWAHDFDSWAICDTTCFHLFDRSPLAWTKAAEWADSDAEFVKRAAFALLWGLSVHAREAPDATFIDALELIVRGADDERQYVKKAVNMALRAIGKRNTVLNSAALETAEALASRDDPSSRWIGNHAVRELGSERVQSRLRDRPRARE